MSLKWFHIVFISLSMLVSLGFGVWGCSISRSRSGLLSLAGSAGALRLRELLSGEGAAAGAYEGR